MRFGPLPLDEAEGAILVHSLRIGGASFKKGRRLSRDDLAALRAAGLDSVTAARLDPGDLHEDALAARVAAALCGPGAATTAAATGRCNLVAEGRGLLVVDAPRLDAVNLVDEAVTVASLPAYAAVEPRQMLATVKIIPFAAPAATLERVLAVVAEGGPPLRVAAFRARRCALIQTRLPGTKESVLDKTRAVTDARLAQLDCPPAVEARVAHEEAAVAAALERVTAEGAELAIVIGASAIVDRRDVVPRAIERAGGRVEHFGMPVDPGNLSLIGRRGDAVVLAAPGSTRSPKPSGFDWILRRVLADLPVTREDIMRMGVGGLLKEIGARPLPRAAAVEARRPPAPARPRIAAVVLAAGQSRRMGATNKLLAEVGGRPMVRHAVEAALASQASEVVLVTGHEAERVRAAAGAEDLRVVHNPDYAQGLSTSLHRGLAALSEPVDGAVILLADMPDVDAAVVDRLIAAFDPAEGRAICLPTRRGKRGNPVLFARRFFAEVQAMSGDVGARALLADYPELVAEVAMGDDAVLHDIDTPEALARHERQAPPG